MERTDVMDICISIRYILYDMWVLENDRGDCMGILIKLVCCHAVGDILQPDWMAYFKSVSLYYCIAHGITVGAIFYFAFKMNWVFFVQAITHTAIDHYTSRYCMTDHHRTDFLLHGIVILIMWVILKVMRHKP